jgi:hypothetical protein
MSHQQDVYNIISIFGGSHSSGFFNLNSSDPSYPVRRLLQSRQLQAKAPAHRPTASRYCSPMNLWRHILSTASCPLPRSCGRTNRATGSLAVASTRSIFVSRALPGDGELPRFHSPASPPTRSPRDGELPRLRSLALVGSFWNKHFMRKIIQRRQCKSPMALIFVHYIEMNDRTTAHITTQVWLGCYISTTGVLM